MIIYHFERFGVAGRVYVPKQLRIYDLKLRSRP